MPKKNVPVNEGFISFASFEHLLYELGLRKIEAKRVDEFFSERKKTEDTRKLSKVSKVLINLWDLAALVMKLKSGESLVIDGDSGRIFRGKVDHKNLEALPEKVPGRTSLTIDGNGTNEFYIAKSWAFRHSSPMKKHWDSRTKIVPVSQLHPVVQLFQERLQEVPKKDVSTNTRVESNHTYVEISIRDWPVTIGMSKSGRVFYYLFEGIRYDI